MSLVEEDNLLNMSRATNRWGYEASDKDRVDQFRVMDKKRVMGKIDDWIRDR